MLRIEVSNLELCRDILQQYTKSSCTVNTTETIVKVICEKLDIKISNDYCYICDLLSYLLDSVTIVLNKRQVDLLMVIINNRYYDYSKTFGNYKFFRDLMSTCLLPIELKNIKIGYVLKKIKESRGE